MDTFCKGRARRFYDGARTCTKGDTASISAATYEDPIESYFIDVSNLVVVNLKLPGHGKPVARIAVGPQGICTYVFWSRNGKVSSRGNASWPAIERFWEHLEEAGFRSHIESSVLANQEIGLRRNRR